MHDGSVCGGVRNSVRRGSLQIAFIVQIKSHHINLLPPPPPLLQALKQMDKFNAEKMELLSERTATPTSQLKFVLDAWMQVGGWVCWGMAMVGIGSGGCWKV